MKSLLTIACFLFASVLTFAQSSNVEISGNVKTEGVTPTHQDEAKTLVTIFYQDEVVEQFFTSNDGYFSYVLNKGHEYNIVFSKAGYYEKQVIYDLENTPESAEKLAVQKSITLFENNYNKAMEELSYTPVARCSFDDSTSEIIWDKKYSQQINEQYYTLAME